MTEQPQHEPDDNTGSQISGEDDPLDDAATDQPQHKTEKRKQRLVIGALLTGFVLILALIVVSSAGGTPAVQAAHESVETTDDFVALGIVSVQDGGETLFIDAPGEDDENYVIGFRVYGYARQVLEELQAPDYLWTQMNQTRALDGRQSASWDGYEVSWTYHPDDGLDLLITTN